MSDAKVYLIGAGPGDPGLLTLRGAQCLAQADVVLYDGLSNQSLLAHAPQAEHICVGKHGQSRIWKQPEIIAETLRHAAQGKRVVRLKGGDPAVFARTVEEVEACHKHGVAFEIVPGITAALAAGSFAGIPITHRKLASAVALVTGHEEPGKTQSAIDWDALARFPGTLVIYMGVTTVEAWTASLIAAGKDPATPTAIIRRCSLPDQQSIHCRLDEVADRLTPASKFRPPVITIIGEVTTLAPTMDWVQRRPLHGQSVLVTRPIEKAEALAAPLRELGANVLVQPAIETAPLDDYSQVDQTLDRWDTFDSIVFCSENGVDHWMQRFLQRFDLRAFGSKRIGCVGSKTAGHLRSTYHLQADWVPDDYEAESLARQMVADHRAPNHQVADHQAPNHQTARVLIVRASRGRDVLSKILGDSGCEVTQVAVYQNRDVTTAMPDIVKQMESGKIDWVTVTSSATANSLHRMFGDALGQTKLASLSPVTSATLRELGYWVTAEASPYTTPSLVEAILKHDS